MKKILFLAVSFFMTLAGSAATRTIWTGSFSSGDWGAAFQPLEATLFEGVEVGNYVVFIATTQSDSQIQIAPYDTSQPALVEYDTFNNKYRLKVTSDNLSTIQGGLQVKGRNFTLTEVQIEEASGSGGENNNGNEGENYSGITPLGTVIWEGNFETGTEWEAYMSLPAERFADVKANGYLVFQGYCTGDYAHIQLANPSMTKYITENQYNVELFNNTFYLKLTPAVMEILAEGLAVKGERMVLNIISYIPPISSNEDHVKGFHTSGAKLLDANDKEFVMRGVNYSYAWQQGHEESVLAAAKRQGCNAVRIQVADGTKWTATSDVELNRLIELCEHNKLICVFNVQDELGVTDVDALLKAARYWAGMAHVLKGHENTVIVNIENEWPSGKDDDLWASGNIQAIPILREAGIKNTIMIDANDWGQYAESIWVRGADVLAADELSNTMFSVHFYEYASWENPSAGTGSKVKNTIDNCLSIGAPLCVGEFGYKHIGGSVDYETVKQYCTEKNVGYFGWSWTGNGGGVEYLDMFSGYDDSEMLTNGECVFLGDYGIKATSKQCSVYDTVNTAITQPSSTDTGSLQVVSKTYYTLSGMPCNESSKGVVIERLQYADGTVKVTKQIR